MNLRTITKDGEPWFVAADVCRALGLADKAGSFAAHTAKVNIADKAYLTGVGLPGTGRYFINESGLYTLVLKSRKPEAKAFQTWVTSVVLPAIRKDGAYVMGEEKVKTGELSMEEMTLRVVSFMQAKAKRLEAERVVHIEKLAEQQPTVEFVERYVESSGTAACLFSTSNTV